MLRLITLVLCLIMEMIMFMVVIIEDKPSKLLIYSYQSNFSSHSSFFLLSPLFLSLESFCVGLIPNIGAFNLSSMTMANGLCSHLTTSISTLIIHPTHHSNHPCWQPTLYKWTCGQKKAKVATTQSSAIADLLKASRQSLTTWTTSPSRPTGLLHNCHCQYHSMTHFISPPWLPCCHINNHLPHSTVMHAFYPKQNSQSLQVHVPSAIRNPMTDRGDREFKD